MADYLNNVEYLKDLFAKIDIASPTPAKKEAASTAVPIVSKPVQGPDNIGLVVEKMKTDSQAAPQVKPTQEKSGPSNEIQTINWFKDTNNNPKLWDSLSEEEKQKRTDIALKGMIDSYNDNQKKIGSNKRMTVAEQYAIYISRCTTEEQVIRLTKSVKSMDKNNQLPAFKSSYKYQNEKYRDIAERILATDYTKLHPDNVVEAARETKNFSEKNRVIAAQNASQVIVAKQPEVVGVLLDEKDENVDMALSNQVGQFGVNKDGTVDKKIQLGCFEQISTSQFQNVVENVAKNIYQLDSENQSPATQIIIRTDNEGAIRAAASQVNKCSEKYQDDIISELNNTKYDSVKQELARQEAEKIAEIQSKETIEKEQNSTTSTAKATTKIDAVVEIIQNKDTSALKDSVKKMSDTDKEKLLNLYPNNVDIISSIVESSSGMLCLKAMDALSKLDEKTQRTIVQSINKNHSNVISSNIALYSSNVQKVFIEDTKASDLGAINRNMLSSLAKAKYDELKMG